MLLLPRFQIIYGSSQSLTFACAVAALERALDGHAASFHEPVCTEGDLFSSLNLSLSLETSLLVKGGAINRAGWPALFKTPLRLKEHGPVSGWCQGFYRRLQGYNTRPTDVNSIFPALTLSSHAGLMNRKLHRL